MQGLASGGGGYLGIGGGGGGVRLAPHLFSVLHVRMKIHVLTLKGNIYSPIQPY